MLRLSAQAGERVLTSKQACKAHVCKRILGLLKQMCVHPNVNTYLTHVHTQIHTHTYHRQRATTTYRHIYTHIHTHIHIHIYTHTNTHTHTHTHAHTHTHHVAYFLSSKIILCSCTRSVAISSLGRQSGCLPIKQLTS